MRIFGRARWAWPPYATVSAGFEGAGHFSGQISVGGSVGSGHRRAIVAFTYEIKDGVMKRACSRNYDRFNGIRGCVVERIVRRWCLRSNMEGSILPGI